MKAQASYSHAAACFIMRQEDEAVAELRGPEVPYEAGLDQASSQSSEYLIV